MTEKFEYILSIKRKEQNHDWKTAEKSFGIEFPYDYKSFIDLYGEGGINEFLWILSPFSECNNLNTLYKFNEMKQAYETIKKDFPQIFEFEFWKNGKGIFPWGITDNGDELYWNYKEKSIDIVVIASRYAERQVLNCSMSEFIMALLEKKIECSIFPEDFIREENYYEF